MRKKGSVGISLIITASIVISLCGCAGGPTHDYYNPRIVDAKFKGPPTMVLVEDVKIETEKCVQQGYSIVGTTDYFGKYPEAKELRAQAKRAGANHVIYSCKWTPNPPGSWQFSFGRGFGYGGTGGGAHEVHIAFLGK